MVCNGHLHLVYIFSVYLLLHQQCIVYYTLDADLCPRHTVVMLVGLTNMLTLCFSTVYLSPRHANSNTPCWIHAHTLCPFVVKYNWRQSYGINTRFYLAIVLLYYGPCCVNFSVFLHSGHKFYFQLIFCPDYDPYLVTTNFYLRLVRELPPETFLKTMLRIVYQAREKKMTEHLSIARTLFHKAATMMKLRYKDIAVLTMTTSQLELFPDLRSHQVDPDTVDSERSVYRWHEINLSFQNIKTWARFSIIHFISLIRPFTLLSFHCVSTANNKLERLRVSFRIRSVISSERRSWEDKFVMRPTSTGTGRGTRTGKISCRRAS